MILLVLGSLSNVVGFQTVQSSNQKIIKEEINQREILFQIIINIINDKEIQRIILKSQITNGQFFISDSKLPTPISKNPLRKMYFIGLLLSKFINKSQMCSIDERYQLNNFRVQKEIAAVIEANNTLNSKMNEFENMQCDCEKNNSVSSAFTTLCTLLFPIVIVLYFLSLVSHIFGLIYSIIEIVGMTLDCSWALGIPE